jgi:hypothetical protein
MKGSDLFERTEEKLRDLGSGSWRGLSDEAGSPHQRAHLGVPLARAKVTKHLYILWQIDVGFDEGTSNTQQLVRGRLRTFRLHNEHLVALTCSPSPSSLGNRQRQRGPHKSHRLVRFPV